MDEADLYYGNRDRGRMRILSATLAMVVGALASGCGATATIHRWGAPALEGELVDADVANIYVTDRTGQRYRVPRKDMAEVDHPGNVLLMAGVAVLALGVSMYFDKDGAPGDTDEELRNRRIAGIGVAVPGALMAAWGGYSWWSSRRIESHRGEVRPFPVPGVVLVSPTEVVVLPAPVLPAPAPLPGSPEAFAPKPSAP